MVDLPYAGTISITGDAQVQAIEALYQTEGEYATALQLHSQVTDAIVLLKEQAVPNFENPNDKLGAHKVFATSLTLRVPSHLDLNLTVDEAQLTLRGIVAQLTLNQNGGLCRLIQWSGPGKINTTKADIVLDLENLSLQTSSPFPQGAHCNTPQGGPVLQVITQGGSIRCIDQ
ncbi:MAG: hypothetical protein ACO3MZ_01675 [Flavobacteriaceae bacterium]